MPNLMCQAILEILSGIESVRTDDDANADATGKNNAYMPPSINAGDTSTKTVTICSVERYLKPVFDHEAETCILMGSYTYY